jgi:hypothetical protein
VARRKFIVGDPGIGGQRKAKCPKGRKTRLEMSAATLPLAIVWGLFLGRGMGEFRIALAIDRGPQMLFSPAERRVRPLACRVARGRRAHHGASKASAIGLLPGTPCFSLQIKSSLDRFPRPTRASLPHSRRNETEMKPGFPGTQTQPRDHPRVRTRRGIDALPTPPGD